MKILLLLWTVTKFVSGEFVNPCLANTWPLDDGDISCGNKGITDETLPGIIAGQSNVIEVKSISLRDNQISHIDLKLFENFTNLQEINLEGNKLTKPPAKISFYLPSITKVVLSGNKISVLAQADFEGYESVKILHLRRNGIQKLDANVFQLLSNLTNLALTSNKIEILRKGVNDSHRKYKILKINYDMHKNFMLCKYQNNEASSNRYRYDMHQHMHSIGIFLTIYLISS